MASPGPAARPPIHAFGPSRGVLVVGHGTADPVGAEESRQVARLVASMLPGVPVELGFLEVIGPSIAESLQRLAARGCREVVAAPLLLFTAGHARQDVPEALREAARMAGVSVRQSAAFGCHEKILALSRLRRRQAVASLFPLPPEATVLVMVGRGSSDPAAPGQLHAFATATLHAADEPLPGRIELGFVAAARPTLAEAIAAAAGEVAGSSDLRHPAHGEEKPGTAGLRGPGAPRIDLLDGTGPGKGPVQRVPVQRVIVQPHLLFSGHVEEQVSAAVRDGRKARPEIEWVQVNRLGPDPLVAEAVVERAAQAADEAWACRDRGTVSPETA